MSDTKQTLLKLAALAGFWIAYRMAAHGVTLKQSGTLVFGCLVFVASNGLLAWAFWTGRKRQ